MITSPEPRPAALDDVRFRRVEKGAATDHDIERMLELLAAVFHSWPPVAPEVAPADHLRWKMSSPAALFSAFLGEAGDELVSTEVCLGFALLLRGRRGVRLQFVDTAVRPEWRRRGVSTKSIAQRQRTVAPLYDVSIIDAQNPIMIQRASRFGTRPLGNAIHPLVLPLRRRDLATRWALERGLPRWAALALAPPIATLLRLRSPPRARSRARREGAGGFQVRDAERFDSRIDLFFAAASAPWEVLMVRSREHLDWRYGDPRGGRFEIRLAEDAQGVLLGYAVGAARAGRGHLVDLLALPGRLDVVAALATEIAEVLEHAGCVDVLCWLPQRHPYRATLHRAGYLDARAKPFITYRPTGASSEELEFLAAPETRVHFMLGDTDLV